ncbi:MAG: 30S ribosomal protein S15 [Candidatus Huberarchaeum crystalense]|uniref:30S ribosomal protein S15 n=1 Tax=Huberarchaeum crystalense TaxID=2014257 RepID=A0A2G9LJJ3_HUBC1|nr:30S ribosomal protein S15 [archaeon]NCS98465.1 30S ribosomal protein S15 [archaeon]PIN66713.1 MAG: 30S ribosomal protein S15 [Candidatus Huberarchaeum crystalense]PIV89781.1 MAG: 30S ribosomal protein S15 [Candidatus Huberarchaeum crystalense]PJC01698.1 MAG: 30S ribosomal protein S15 [Candidatus Huberarchaeum crystalense]
MARQHTRKKGQSRSLRPMIAKNTNFNISKNVVEKAIGTQAKQGKSSSEIGASLRDSYGVPDAKKALGRGIVLYLKEKDLIKKDEFPEDLKNLMTKAIALHTHLQTNKHDAHNRNNFLRIKSKIKRLIKYYQHKNYMLDKWRFTIENAKLIIGEVK